MLALLPHTHYLTPYTSKGHWATEFPESATHESGFWIGADDVRADFMSVLANFKYTYADDVDILKMPYKVDRLSMLALLPHKMDGAGFLEKVITPDILEERRQSMHRTEVEVSISKFEVKTHHDLVEPLGNLDVLDVFNPARVSLLGIANLTDLDNLYVSKAVQDAYVKINEEGQRHLQ